MQLRNTGEGLCLDTPGSPYKKKSPVVLYECGVTMVKVGWFLGYSP